MFFSMSADMRRGENRKIKRPNIAEKEEDYHHSGSAFASPPMPRLRRQLLADVRADERTDGGRDLISLLPDECVQMIFTFVASPRDRCACAAACKKWLLLLAHMRGSYFKPLSSASGKASGPADEAAAVAGSRCLEEREANDARVAAMAVGTYSDKLLGVLSLRGGGPPSFITDFGLRIISRSFPNLRSLSLWDCFRVSSSGLACIAQCCPGLEKLDIMNSPRIDDDGFLPIGRNCRKLATLIIESCPLVGNKTLESFAETASSLESISITNCPSVGDAGIISIVSQLPKLTKLRLSQLTIGDGVLRAIGKHGAGSSTIKVLSLENVTGITMAGFSWIESCAAGNLESLTFRSTCDGFTGAAGFGLMQGKDVVTSQTAIGCCRLKHVEIKDSYYLTDKELLSLTKSTQMLESLKLHKCPSITISGLMGAIRNCSSTSLKSLSLTKCDSISGNGSRKDERENGGRRRHASLESLTLKKCAGMGDRFMSTIGPLCSNLSHLGLVGLSSVTDRGIASLLRWVSPSGANTAPARVALRDCSGVTDRSVAAVARAFGGRLSSLSLGGCRGVGDRSLDAVAERCPGLTELDVSRCGGVSDWGVGRLARAEHQKLRVLSLAGCEGVTDLSLCWLEVMCGGLVGLDVRRCGGVTSSGVDSVRETLWWCDLLADY